MKDFYVGDAPRFENVVVTSYFVLSGLSVREKKSGGGQYVAMTLSDKTGALEARMWEEFTDVVSSCGEGCYVKVQGKIERYGGKFQITLLKIRSAAEIEIDTADYRPTSQFNVEEMQSELRCYVSAFRNEHLRRLVLAFLDDDDIGTKFVVAPAAKTLHHAWLGGLLEHVLSLVRVCLAIVPLYPEIDPDLLVTGAILHDIGKVRELEWKTSFAYTLEGQMLGHITIGIGMLREKLASHPDFPPNLRILVEHMILSHHGRYEFGSPKLPMTAEALLLSSLDDLEAKMQGMRAAFARDLATGKSAANMTDWVRNMERPLLDSRAYLQTEQR